MTRAAGEGGRKLGGLQTPSRGAEGWAGTARPRLGSPATQAAPGDQHRLAASLGTGRSLSACCVPGGGQLERDTPAALPETPCWEPRKPGRWGALGCRGPEGSRWPCRGVGASAMLLVSGAAVTEDHKQQKGTASQLWRPVCLQAAILRRLRGTVRSLPFPAPGDWPATLSAPGLVAALLLSQPAITRPSTLPVCGAVDACHCTWGHPNLGGSHLQILLELHLHQPRVQRNPPSEGPRGPTLGGPRSDSPQTPWTLSLAPDIQGTLPRCCLQSLHP